MEGELSDWTDREGERKRSDCQDWGGGGKWTIGSVDKWGGNTEIGGYWEEEETRPLDRWEEGKAR